MKRSELNSESEGTLAEAREPGPPLDQRIEPANPANAKSESAEYAIELAKLKFLGGRASEGIASLEALLQTGDLALSAQELEACERLLDEYFTTGPSDAISRLYLRLAQLGSKRRRTALRAFSYAVGAGEWDAATPLLEFVGAAQNPKEHLDQSTYFLSQGDRESVVRQALEAAAGAISEQRGNPAFVRRVVGNLCLVGEFDQAEAFFAQTRGQLPQEDVDLLDLAVRAERLTPTSTIPATIKFATADRFGAVLDHVHDRFSEEQADAACDLLERRFPESTTLFIAMTRLQARKRHFTRATEFANHALQCAKTDNARFNARFWLFQIEVFARRLERAAELLADFKLEELNSGRLQFVSEYYAEAGMFDVAFTLLLRSMEDCQDVSSGLYQHAVRTSRRVKGQHAILDALAQRPGALPFSLRQLAQALFEDWAADAGLGHADAARFLEAIELDITPMLEIKLSVLAPKELEKLKRCLPAVQTPRRAVFYCADDAYLLPAMVSLASLLNHNPDFTASRFYVVVDDKLESATAAVLKKLSQHFGIRATVQPSSQLIADVSALRTAWGYFTAGKGLSPAAYYRIYMAHRLAASGEFDQMLYIDSDTVVSHGFQGLYSLPVGPDVLLRAALDRVEVGGIIEATRRHGLVEGTYFNSGILWFPNVNEALIERLKEAERLAVERADQLMFLDQCALNIAFAGANEPLPRRFNYFAAPRDVDEFAAVPPSKSCLVHMTDRPKPWDSVYPTDSLIKQRWIDALCELRHLVGDKLLQPLIKATYC